MIAVFQKYFFLLRDNFHLYALIAFIAGIILTVIVKKLAVWLNVVDIPNKRKMHAKPMPLLGGVSIFSAFALTLLILYYGTPNYRQFFNLEFFVILLAAFFIHIIGIIDDIKHLSPMTKLYCQIAAAAAVAIVGARTRFFIDNIYINTLITIFWIVGITNSFNLLDNMDGLSCGVALIAATLFFLVNINQGDYFLALVSLIIASAAAGFLIFNFSPASIFMGDGGSLFLGFIISVIAVKTVYLKYSLLTRLPVITPLLILFIPIYDTLSVIFIRKKLGIPIFTADKRHFSHRLVNLGLSPRSAVLIIYMATLSTGITSTLLPKLKAVEAIIVLIHTFMIFGIIAILEWFGFKKNEDVK